jgi:hypothetical protein
MDLTAEWKRMQIAAEEHRLARLAKFGEGFIGGVLDVIMVSDNPSIAESEVTES